MVSNDINSAVFALSHIFAALDLMSNKIETLLIAHAQLHTRANRNETICTDSLMDSYDTYVFCNENIIFVLSDTKMSILQRSIQSATVDALERLASISSMS